MMDTKVPESIEQAAHESITIRIVFDGAPYAGKTTAAYSLSEALGELAFTPSEDDQGRTEWFDWMSYTGGRHDGKSIRVELVTVPGQEMLNERRRYLLQWGDVVVFIADTAADAMEATVQKFATLRNDLKEIGEVPIVAIANKRDVEDAVPLEEVRDRLILHEGESLIEAIATTGGGIRQAFIFAVRAALTQTRDPRDQMTAHALMEEMATALVAPLREDAVFPDAVLSDATTEETAAKEPAAEVSGLDGWAPALEAAIEGEEVEPDQAAEAEANPPAVSASSEPASSEPTSSGSAPSESASSEPALHRYFIAGAVPEGSSIVLHPIHWDVLVALGNTGTVAAVDGDSSAAQATRDLVTWGLIDVPHSAIADQQEDPTATATPAGSVTKPPLPRRRKATVPATPALIDQTETSRPADVVEPAAEVVEVAEPVAELVADQLRAPIHPYAKAPTSQSRASTEYRNQRYRALRELRHMLRA